MKCQIKWLKKFESADVFQTESFINITQPFIHLFWSAVAASQFSPMSYSPRHTTAEIPIHRGAPMTIVKTNLRFSLRFLRSVWFLFGVALLDVAIICVTPRLSTFGSLRNYKKKKNILEASCSQTQKFFNLRWKVRTKKKFRSYCPVKSTNFEL